MTIDHTLSWEVARVGGMLAYVLTTGSVVIGLLVSLKLRSPAWPRFLTTELHRFVTVLALVFSIVHGLAVWVDPFTGFGPSEVLVPGVSHYRPLWVALGIVGGYLLVAVWASEYVRRWIGYAWWRRFHFIAFAAFVLATVHGIGTGSDTATPWALALYGVSTFAVLALVGWRLLSGPESIRRAAAFVLVSAAVAGGVVFTALGPARAGWNEIANEGNGSGASDAWLAANEVASAPTTAFSVPVSAQLVREGLIVGTFSGAADGSIELRLDARSVLLSLTLSDGWSCSGDASTTERDVLATCRADDGSAVEVDLGSLRAGDGRITGTLAVEVPTPAS